MKMKACSKCRSVWPATSKYFYFSGLRSNLRSECKNCFRDRQRKLDHGRVKIPKALPVVKEEPIVQCRNWSRAGCEIRECRYHMNELKRRKISPEKIISCKYTCLFEITDIFPHGLDQAEIAGILGVSKQRVFQIEKDALAKLRKKAEHLSVYLEDEVNILYRKPERVLGVGKISEGKIVPVFGANLKNFDKSTLVREHEDLQNQDCQP